MHGICTARATPEPALTLHKRQRRTTTGRQSGTRTRITSRRLLVGYNCARVRPCCCAGYWFALRGRVVVLDWAGELDQEWKELHHLCGLLRSLWVLESWM